MVVRAKLEIFVGIKKISPEFSLSTTNDIVLHRADTYQLRKSDLIRSPIRFLRFYFARRFYDLLSTKGANAAQQEACNKNLVLRYALLVYGEKLCAEDLRRLISLETQERISRNLIRKTLKDLNVIVDRRGVLRIEPPSRSLKWIGFGILAFSIPFAAFLLFFLVEGLFFINCPPRCAIVGAIELLMLSGLVAQFGSKLTFIHIQTQIVVARRLSKSFEI